MDWLKRHWVEIVVIGSLQALVGLVATASMQAFLSSDAAKDAGIIVLWLAVVAAGAAVLIARSIRPASAPELPQDERRDRSWQPPVAVSELGSYLDQINKTMGEKGFGTNPNLQPALEFGNPAAQRDGVLQVTMVEGARPLAPTLGNPGHVQRYPREQRKIINYRIPLTNHGAACDVRVKIEGTQPDIDGVELPVTLHLARDDPDPYSLKREFKQTFPLARDETVYLDVVARDFEDAAKCYLWNVAYEDGFQEVRLGGTHILKLRAYAGDVNVEAYYEVYADAMLSRLEMKGPLGRRTAGGAAAKAR